MITKNMTDEEARAEALRLAELRQEEARKENAISRRAQAGRPKVYVVVQGYDETFIGVHTTEESAEREAAVDQNNRAVEVEFLHGAPRWTTEKPTKAGWYWVTWNGDVAVVRLETRHDGYLGVGGTTHDYGYEDPTLTDFDLWAGPIEAPPLPEER